jgi:hypothetical protein
VNVTTVVISKLSSVSGSAISSITPDFIVDRVYSCLGPGGDDMAVIEGHR